MTKRTHSRNLTIIIIGTLFFLTPFVWVFYQRFVAAESPPITNEITPTSTPPPVIMPSPTISPALNPIERPRQVAVNNNAFAEAAKSNAALKFDLKWNFAGRQHRGWLIYEPLLRQTFGLEMNAKDIDFAAALARFQEANQIPSNGVMDETTMLAIIKFWQTNRLKERGVPPEGALFVAPTKDFFDVARLDELRQVELETYAAYKKMIAAACADKSLKLKTNGKGELAPDEQFLKILSAFRSPEYQAKLREKSPNSGRIALALNSPHFTGRALDVYVGFDAVSTEDFNRLQQSNTPVYRWLVKNAGKFGFKPYFYEPWHWEYAPDADTIKN